MSCERFRAMATIVVGVAFAVAIGAMAFSQETGPKPVKISKADIAGSIFERADTLRIEHDNGNTTLDVTTLLSSDARFGSGMYRSGKVRELIDAPYGVDEFMYFLDGGVRLTSADGTVQVISAGEAVTIPKEWTGLWETDGYTKIWVIYSDDGSGL